MWNPANPPRTVMSKYGKQFQKSRVKKYHGWQIVGTPFTLLHVNSAPDYLMSKCKQMAKHIHSCMCTWSVENVSHDVENVSSEPRVSPV